MSKSSLEYTELHGLRLALLHVDTNNKEVAVWIKNRIEELEKK